MTESQSAKPDDTDHYFVNNIDVTCFEGGLRKKSASRVVFVHGSVQDYRSWRFQFEPFATQYHILAYSRRNHFPNRWSEYPIDYSLKTERDDLLGLLKELELASSPVHLVGSSYGAFISLLLARDYAQLVRSLTISEPPILSMVSSKDPEFYQLSKLSYDQNIAEPLRRGDYESGVRQFVDSSEGKGAFDHLPHDVQTMMIQNARTLLMEDPKPERDPFSCSDTRQIKCPVLLVRGTNSPIMYELINDQLESCLTQSSTVVIGNTSHSIHNQNPYGYNTAVLSFLSGC